MELKYMQEALKEAQKAYKKEEVPIGAVIVHRGKIIGRGYNLRETSKQACSHAEIIAIQKACKKLGTWRLRECDMYVTLEPCPMCAGAIINSRIKNLYIGAKEPKSGAVGSVLNLFEDYKFNHKANVVTGVLEEDSTSLLQRFFKDLREKNKKTSKL